MVYPARDTGYQLAHYLRRTLNVPTMAAGTYDLGTLPADAMVVKVDTYTTANLSGTTNTLTIGYAEDGLSTADADAYVASVALPTTTGGHVSNTIAATTSAPRNHETNVTFTWAGTATTGVVEIAMQYLPKR